MKLARHALARSFAVLNLTTINPDLAGLDFAARGPIETDLFLSEMGVANGERFAFEGFLPLHSGNGQKYGLPALTFNRQVLALCLQPALLGSHTFSADAQARAREYLAAFRSLGCYTESAGNGLVTKSVAAFIARRDGLPTDAKLVMVYNGASEALSSFLQTIAVRGQNCGVLAPAPLVPDYSARTALSGANSIGYQLDAQRGWQVDEAALFSAYDNAAKQGLQPKAIIAVNPGNPTGALLTRASIQSIFKLAYERGLVVLANEVNQEAVFTKDKEFVSFRKVLSELPAEVAKSIELISFNSCSKGLHGEGGLRGGYAELHNIHPAVTQEIYKLKTIFLSSSSAGQIMLDLMVRPPTKESASEETVTQYNREIKSCHQALKTKADLLHKTMRSMKGFSFESIEAGYQGFPKVDLPKKLIEEAKFKNIPADLLYCRQVLLNTGVALSPGSTYQTTAGQHYIRCSILGEPLSFYSQKLEAWRKFNDQLMNKYQ